MTMRIFSKWRNRVKVKLNTLRFRLRQKSGYILLKCAVIEARQFLKNSHPVRILVDNSTLGHGVVDETAWIDTGVKKWGHFYIQTGYIARISVYREDSESTAYKEIRYLYGITELARQNIFNLLTSCELEAERFRHPIGRFKGYWICDHSVFAEIKRPSVDGYVFNPRDTSSTQKARINEKGGQELIELMKFFQKKQSFDVFHILTAHRHNVPYFLTMDFAFIKQFNESKNRNGFPQLRTEPISPSQLGRKYKIRPVESHWMSLRGASFPVRSDLYNGRDRRTKLNQTTVIECEKK